MKIKSLLLTLMLATAAQAQNSSTSLSFDLKGLEPTDTLMLQWGANNKSMNPLIGKRSVGDAQPFVIEGTGSEQVRTILLNGRPLNRSFLDHSDLTNGGTLLFSNKTGD